MTYATYAEGFKGGGWNSHFNRPQTPEEQARFQKFDQEEVKSYELGFKADLLDSTLRLNGAIFQTDYTDLQFTYRVGVAPYLANAGEAKIDGFEVEATWVPTANLRIDAGYGYLDSEIEKLEEIAGTAIGVEVGNVLPFAPEGTFNIGAAYDITVGDLMITPRADLFWQDTTYFDANNTEEIAQLDDYTKLNLGVTIAPIAGPWEIRAGVNNATDEIYAVGGNSSLTTGSGYAEIGYARERWYFVNASYSF
jgi:iron complex outermembrane receptor protein